MPEIALSELAIIAVLALIIIGPKDLPKALRSIGKATRSVRDIADQVKDAFYDLEQEVYQEERKAELTRIRKSAAEFKEAHRKLKTGDVGGLAKMAGEKMLDTDPGDQTAAIAEIKQETSRES